MLMPVLRHGIGEEVIYTAAASFIQKGIRLVVVIMVAVVLVIVVVIQVECRLGCIRRR
jgi:hypothetical protein